MSFVMMGIGKTPTPAGIMNPQQRVACVLFADVTVGARLSEKLGDAEALHAAERCVNRMERASAVHGGRVIGLARDELSVVFDSADAAAQAAREMQQRVDDLPPVSGVKFAVRIGFQAGGFAAGDPHAVSGVAMGMARLAQPGQIVIGPDAAAALSPPLRALVRELPQRLDAGAAGRLKLFELPWQDSPPPPEKVGKMIARPPAGQLVVRHGDRALTMDTTMPTLSMGRDTTSDVVILDRRASRNHARIERRRDKFVLSDESTNGTYVQFAGEAEFCLKHEEVILRGRGSVSFGHSHLDGEAETVEFEVEG